MTWKKCVCFLTMDMGLCVRCPMLKPVMSMMPTMPVMMNCSSSLDMSSPIIKLAFSTSSGFNTNGSKLHGREMITLRPR